MLILDYFKKKLPYPKGTLSCTMPIRAITSANEEVEASSKRLGTGKKSNKKTCISTQKHVHVHVL